MGIGTDALSDYTVACSLVMCCPRSQVYPIADVKTNGRYFSVFGCGICDQKTIVEFDPDTAPVATKNQLDVMERVYYIYTRAELAALHAQRSVG